MKNTLNRPPVELNADIDMQELLREISKQRRLAAELRTAMTKGLAYGNELVENGLVILLRHRLAPGKHPERDDIITMDEFDPSNDQHCWSLSLYGVLTLHVFEPEWFHVWQMSRHNRN